MDIREEEICLSFDGKDDGMNDAQDDSKEAGREEACTENEQ